MARCAIRAAQSGATCGVIRTSRARLVPPALTRAGTSQRDVPTLGAGATFSHLTTRLVKGAA